MFQQRKLEIFTAIIYFVFLYQLLQRNVTAMTCVNVVIPTLPYTHIPTGCAYILLVSVLVSNEVHTLHTCQGRLPIGSVITE